MFGGSREKLVFQIRVLAEQVADLPLPHGVIYIRWKVKGQKALRGFTRRVPLQGHVASWEPSDVIVFLVQMEVERVTGVLLPCPMRFSVRLETKGGKAFFQLGHVDLDLAEFAGARSTHRRFLLQQSRVNATLHLELRADLVSGAPTFKARAPPSIPDEEEREPPSAAGSGAADAAETSAALRWRERWSLPKSLLASRVPAQVAVEAVLLRLQDQAPQS
jgi:hypothetical protein